MPVEEWEIRVTNDLLGWIRTLDVRTRAQVVDAIDPAGRGRPRAGPPLG